MDKSNSLEYTDSFAVSDYYLAKRAFSVWQSSQYGELDDYLLRQRKAELYALVRKVVKNELDKTEQLIVKLRFEKEYSLKQIAAVLGVDTSTVSRRLNKIDDTLYEKLKYAMEYRFGKNAEPTMLLVKKDVGSALKKEAETTVSSRLRCLRRKNYISLTELSKCTDISLSKLEKAEKGEVTLSAVDVMKLSEFYCVTSDYILFGKKRIIRDENTGLPTYRCC